MGLLDLQYESLVIICGYLEDKELFKLRLTSKHLKQVVDRCGCWGCCMEVMLWPHGFGVDLQLNGVYRNMKNIIQKTDFCELGSSREVERGAFPDLQDGEPHKDACELKELIATKKENNFQGNASVIDNGFQKTPSSVRQEVDSAPASREENATKPKVETEYEGEGDNFGSPDTRGEVFGFNKTSSSNGPKNRNDLDSFSGKRAYPGTPDPPSSAGFGSDSPCLRKSVSTTALTQQKNPRLFFEKIATSEPDVKKGSLTKQTLFDSFSGKRTKLTNEYTPTLVKKENDGDDGFDFTRRPHFFATPELKKEPQAPLSDVRSDPIARNNDVFDEPFFIPEEERSKVFVSTPISELNGPDDHAIGQPVLDDPLTTPKQELPKASVSSPAFKSYDEPTRGDRRDATSERSPSECTTVYEGDEEKDMSTANTTSGIDGPARRCRELYDEERAIVFWVSQLERVVVRSSNSAAMKLATFLPILKFLQLPIFNLSGLTLVIPKFYEAQPDEINEFMVAISRSQSIASVEAGFGSLDLAVPPVVTPWDKLSTLTVALKTTAISHLSTEQFTSVSYPNLTTVAIVGQNKGTPCRVTVSNACNFLLPFGNLVRVLFKHALVDIDEDISSFTIPNIRKFKLENIVIENTSQLPQFSIINTLLKGSLLPVTGSNIIRIYPNKLEIFNGKNTHVTLKRWSPVEILNHITATNTAVHRIEFTRKPVLTTQLLDNLKLLPNLHQLSAQVDGSQLKQSMTRHQIKKSIVAAIRHLARNCKNLSEVSFHGPEIPRGITYDRKSLKNLARWF
ncbi:hypothetical protein TRICI_000144 [Trichomonascus ciferrii]|uniref:F-box domain-containing protein n=1 Tax=Trichomonascus ciferrii TaxID=44093 RepID=A0A642VE90_9ASCO|nr:hypothetical protein TRICI_000144 [Trichomonascus ciferrii]